MGADWIKSNMFIKAQRLVYGSFRFILQFANIRKIIKALCERILFSLKGQIGKLEILFVLPCHYIIFFSGSLI